MIYIGVTGWGDHDSLYGAGIPAKEKLSEYAGHFPTVEVDASFYAIQPIKNAQRWVEQVPDGFQFVVKAYQGMTGHQRGGTPFETEEDMFTAFKESLAPYISQNKLAMVLFQFPPWFECKKENVEYLRFCKKEMGDLPCAVEFRHQSWYAPEFRTKTLEFLTSEGWIHTVCDEPQAGSGSIPIVLESTNPDKTLVRFHGRNVHGWQKKNAKNWREVRYLYKYNQQELSEWAELLKTLQQQSKDLYVLFNNNSGGDAAGNAKDMIGILGLEYDILAPRQLDLF